MTGGANKYMVTPSWLADHLDDPNVVLVEIAGLRQDEMQAYRAGHVPGAQCWLWKQSLWDEHARDFPAPDDFARRMGAAGITNDTTVVIYGEAIQFGIYAWWALRYCGHEDVRILDGGRYAWQAENRPLDLEFPPAPAPADYRPTARREAMRISRDEVLAALGKPGTAIVDARSPEEYAGLRVGGPGGADVGAVRPGRIPGARHFYYQDLLDEHMRFRSRDELAALAEAVGVVDGAEAIAYCRMSHRATVAYFALTEILGHPGVRVYDGSWTEWGNLVGVPIER